MLEENKPIFSNISDLNHLNHPHPPSPAGNKYLVTNFFLKNSILTRTFFPNKPRPKQKKKKTMKEKQNDFEEVESSQVDRLCYDILMPSADLETKILGK